MMTSRFTILGASGFVGSNLARRLIAQGFEVHTPARNDALGDRHLGHVIYSIGVTADFRTRLLDTAEAHVSRLIDVLRHGNFESLLYLSSTRIYQGARTANEDARISVDPATASDLYNISKLAGESLCLTHSNPAVRVARLSNVYGIGMDSPDAPSDNFLAAICRDAVSHGRIELKTSLDSEKDYISVDDVTDSLVRIALSGKHRVYNVASGHNVTNGELATLLKHLTGCQVEVVPDAPVHLMPPIDVTRLRTEFAAAQSCRNPGKVVDCLAELVDSYCREPLKKAATAP